jgi:hypothetical protein
VIGTTVIGNSWCLRVLDVRHCEVLRFDNMSRRVRCTVRSAEKICSKEVYQGHLEIFISRPRHVGFCNKDTFSVAIQKIAFFYLDQMMYPFRKTE